MKKLLALLAAFMLILAALAWWLTVPTRSAADTAYTFATAEFGPMVETVSATGVVQPQEQVPVGTELSGKVVEVAADFNQVVQEGDLLFRLDDRTAQLKVRQADVAVRLARAEVDRAKAARDAARKSFERLRDLPENVSLRKDIDAAEAQFQAAEAGVVVAEVRVREAEEGRALAEHALQLTEVRAPVLSRPSAAREVPRRKYIVLDRKVELNQQIGPPIAAQAFLLAGDLSQMQVAAQVAEGDIGRVRRGQPVEFTVATFADEVRFHGRVSDLRLLPNNDHGAIFYKVMIDAANVPDPASGEWQLRPGMTASVDVIVRRREATWKVPLAALNLELPASLVTEAARARLERWRTSADREKWQVVWVLGEAGKPWPVLVRTAAGDAKGETALRDAQATEVLEWDTELHPQPGPQEKATYPRVITGVAAPGQGGLFSLPRVKI